MAYVNNKELSPLPQDKPPLKLFGFIVSPPPSIIINYMRIIALLSQMPRGGPQN